jgi:VanZ family protein
MKRVLWSRINLARLWRAGGWLIIAVIVYLSIVPVFMPPDIPQGDKYQHLLAYGTLMGWWSQLYVEGARRWKLALAFIALGATMEVVQSFTPNRYPEWLDIAANSTGVLLGWLAAPPRGPNLYARLTRIFS